MSRTAILPAVILAGGRSERMGFPKVKLSRNGKPLLLQMAEYLKESGWFLDCVVVSGDDLAHWVCNLLKGTPVFQNYYPDQGTISSLRLALRGAKPGTKGILAWPVDHPLIEVETLKAIRSAALRVNAVVPTFEGKRGHPTWWGRGSWKLLKSPVANFGAKHLLRSSELNVAEVAVDDPGILVNVDTPDIAQAFGIEV